MSVECLEVHYRIYASILKYLELHEGMDILSTLGKFFKKCLETAAFPKYGELKKVNKEEKKEDKPIDETTQQTNVTTEKPSVASTPNISVETTSKNAAIMVDVKNCLEKMLDQLEAQSNGSGESNPNESKGSSSPRTNETDNNTSDKKDVEAKSTEPTEKQDVNAENDAVIILDSDEDMNVDPLETSKIFHHK